MSTAGQEYVAILVASVVGYDRLRKLNATGAGDRLDLTLRTVARIASDRGGRLFSGGDDAALEFVLPTPVDAVESAIEIQETLARYNAELSAIDHLACGIGVAFGEGFVEGQGLGGDAVLVARRLTRRARPGTTLVSKEVFRRVRPHLHFSYRRYAQPAISGTSRPLEAYQIKRAPPDGGGSRRRRWARRTRGAAADLRALAGAAWTGRAPAGHARLAAAGLGLAVLGLAAITAIAYERWTAEPETVASTTAERPQAALEPEPAPIPESPPSEAAPAEAASAGPAAATEAAEAGPGATDAGSSVSEAVAALWARLFPEPEVDEPPAAPAVAAAPAPEPAPAAAPDEPVETAEAPPAPEAAAEAGPQPAIEAEVEAKDSAPPADRDQRGLPVVDKRSIVVLPFANASGDPARAYFSEGVTETLTNSLTRFPHLHVIARESALDYRDKSDDPVQIGKDLGVRYLLEGTAARTSDDLVLIAQLIDATTGDQVWQPAYDVRSSDPSNAERMLIQQVLLSLDGRDPKSAPSDGFGFEPVGTVSLEAYDYGLQWRSLFDQSRQADNVRAREAALRAVELDGGYAAAYAFVAWTYMADYWRGWTSDPNATVQQALHWATRGLDRDARDYNVHWALGDIYQTLGEFDKAVAAYETALALNPEVAGLLEDFGTWMLPLQGRAQEGVALAEKAMRLHPRHPDTYYGDVAFNQYLLGNYDQAIRSVERIAEPRLDHRLYLAASYAEAERPDAASREVAAVLKEHQTLTVEQFLANYPFKNAADLEHLRAGLLKAGLPAGRIN